MCAPKGPTQHYTYCRLFGSSKILPPHFFTHLTPPRSATALGYGVGEAVLQALARPHSKRVALQRHLKEQTTTEAGGWPFGRPPALRPLLRTHSSIAVVKEKHCAEEKFKN